MTESVGVVPAGLETLNGQPTTEAEERLRTCCPACRWVARMIAGRPYGDVDSLLKRSDEAFRDLGPGDVAEALASHPRIGQRVAGASTEAAWSRQGQAAMTDADAEVRAALHDGNVATRSASVRSSSSARRGGPRRRCSPSSAGGWATIPIPGTPR